MKKYLSILLIMAVGVGCNNITSEKQSRVGIIMFPDDKETFHIRSIVVDSCEYLIIPDDPAGWSITHKGSCKFCEERKRKQYIIYDEQNTLPGRWSDTSYFYDHSLINKSIIIDSVINIK